MILHCPYCQDKFTLYPSDETFSQYCSCEYLQYYQNGEIDIAGIYINKEIDIEFAGPLLYKEQPINPDFIIKNNYVLKIEEIKRNLKALILL